MGWASLGSYTETRQKTTKEKTHANKITLNSGKAVKDAEKKSPIFSFYLFIDFKTPLVSTVPQHLPSWVVYRLL